jgi:hypothetical protein
MSATLDAGKFQTYFDGAPLLKLTTITFTVSFIGCCTCSKVLLFASGLDIR